MAGEDELRTVSVEIWVREHPENHIQEMRMQARINLVYAVNAAVSKYFDRRDHQCQPCNGSIAFRIDREGRRCFSLSLVAEKKIAYDRVRFFVV